MFDLDDITNESNKEHNENWLYIPDVPYRILIIGGSGSEKKKLIVFDDINTDIMINKKFHAIIKDLFISCKKLHISLVFLSQSYFSVPKDVRSSTTHLFIMNINNKRKLQNIAINNSAD